MPRSRVALGCLLALLGVSALGTDCSGRPVEVRLSVDPAAAGEPLPRALLGHYDLSGALFDYDETPDLIPSMAAAGFVGADWRVGLGRWEAATRLLPTLPDGTRCPVPTPAAAAPPGATDLDLIRDRDWFVDDGTPVALADTADDTRYALDYARSVVDVAFAFGATPFLSVDAMPRALAANRTPFRDDCLWSFKNRVSNVRPADAGVFSAALVGAIERLVAGEGVEPGRPLTHVEIWNEPELAFFWDPAFEDRAGPLDRFFEMAINALVGLDALRQTSPHPDVQALRIGLGSFASPGVPETVVGSFDTARLPNGATIPMDFLSFHAYGDDPLDIVARIESVARASAATSHYADIELVLAEWGPNLQTRGGDAAYAASMAPALHVATVLSLGAAAGLDRAHHAILFDFYPGLIQLGILDGAIDPKPAHRAYALLSQVITGDAVLLRPAGFPDGRLTSELSVLVSRGGDGVVRMLFTNRGTTAARVDARLAGGAGPSETRRFVNPEGGIEASVAHGAVVQVPPQSLVLAIF